MRLRIRQQSSQVAVVVISGGGKGDRPAGNPDVKVPDGWSDLVRSVQGASNLIGRSNVRTTETSKFSPRVMDWDITRTGARAPGAGGVFHLMAAYYRAPNQSRICKLALRHRIPAVSESLDWAKCGFLLTCGQDLSCSVARAMDYVDKILRGAKPSDLASSRQPNLIW
jgi:hypothetical protein